MRNVAPGPGSADHLNAASAKRGDARRAARRGVRMRAQLRDKGTPFEILVVDLSATGFRGETVYKLWPGARVFISLPGLAGIEAKVAWRDHTQVGCAFVTPLHPAVLDHITRSVR